MEANEQQLAYKVIEAYSKSPIPGLHDDKWPKIQQAYIIATVWHETAGTFLPIDELGSPSYFMSKYWTKQSVRTSLGNQNPSDALDFKGRGYVQLTGRHNYAKFDTLLGVPLLARPDLANDPDIALRILLTGMRVGLFTGLNFDKTAVRYGPTKLGNLRRIVNGTDKFKTIGERAADYLDTLLSVDSQQPVVRGGPSIRTALVTL